ncbi:MAG: 2-oxoacid:acceptor oxidoreductase subunit alpha [Euryarchaeota archaeon]|nr:2-oxoacid:acceptor oxidoreductase subunit alpha [Euryarchaeota archaeon]
MQKNKFSWMVGGPQGSGIDSSARMFALSCARGGLYVYGRREYCSNIKGEHSYFQLRIEDRLVRSPINDVHLLASYDNETIARHLYSGEVVPGSAVIYDSALVKQKIEDIGTLDHRLQEEMTAYLKKKGKGDTVADMLEDAKEKGIRLVPLPYGDIIAELGKELNIVELSKLTIMKNTICVGASLGAVGYDFTILEEVIRDQFKGKAGIADNNILAAKKGYDRAHSLLGGFPHKLEKVSTAPSDKRMYLQGSQAVGMGKILAGCKFQTYYPITPATDESEFLEQNPQYGTVVVQTEDEIAAVTMAVGSALTGVRSSTSTSGPGFGLMAEGLGWAGINEVPVVVINYQRAGPSTGLPTRHEQGDLKFALYVGHGDYPRIVLAPGDLEQCFFDTVDAFNYAETYQTPVILLCDKNLANNSQVVPMFDASKAVINRGKLLTEAETEAKSEDGLFNRYNYSADGISNRPVLGMKGGIHWATGDEHTERGHITEDPVIRNNMMEKRAKKMETMLKDIPDDKKAVLYGDKHADVTIVSWGSTKGTVLDAIDRLKAEGLKVNLLQIRLMSPFPVDVVTRLLASAKIKVGLEMNFSGQMCRLVRQETGVAMDHQVIKYNGRPMTEDEVVGAVKQILNKKTPKVVLTHGV